MCQGHMQMKQMRIYILKKAREAHVPDHWTAFKKEQMEEGLGNLDQNSKQ